MDFNTQGKFNNTQMRENIRHDKTEEEKTLKGNRATNKEETQKVSSEGINIVCLSTVCQVLNAKNTRMFEYIPSHLAECKSACFSDP